MSKHRQTELPHEPVVLANDSELMMRFVRHRDQSAFEDLIRKYAPLVYGTCRQILGDRDDIDDAFQTTFLTLAERSQSIHGRDCISSWLYKVAYRTSIRSAKRRRTTRTAQAITDDFVSSCDVFSTIATREQQAVLHEEMNRIPEAYRAALVLCYFNGRSRQEAAEELDCTDVAIKGRLARGRKLLRTRLLRRGVAFSSAVAAASICVSESKAGGITLLIEDTLIQFLQFPTQSMSKPYSGESVMSILSNAKVSVAAATAGLVLIGAIGATAARTSSMTAEANTLAIEFTTSIENADKTLALVAQTNREVSVSEGRGDAREGDERREADASTEAGEESELAVRGRVSPRTSREKLVVSGPQPGSTAPPFTVTPSGTSSKTSTVLNEEHKDVALVYFIGDAELKQVDRVVDLLLEIDAKASEAVRRRHFVWLTNHKTELERKLRDRLSDEDFRRLSITVSTDGKFGPKQYNLKTDKFTALVVKEGNVVWNNVDDRPNVTDAAAILKAARDSA